MSAVLEKRREKLVAGLKALGTGKKQIAAALKAKKVLGDINEAETCPVAIYVKKLFPKAQSVEVDEATLIMTYKSGEEVRATLSKAMQVFLKEYDEGRYPELVAAKASV